MRAVSIDWCNRLGIKVVFDSDVIVSIRRGTRPELRETVSNVKPGLRFMGLAGYLELLFKHSVPRQERDETRRLIRALSIKYLPLSTQADEWAYQALSTRHFEPPDDKPLDLLHAALAVTARGGGALATLNKKHFERVSHLSLVEDF